MKKTGNGSVFAQRAQTWLAIESIKNALSPLGIEDRQTYRVTFDGNGNVTVHTFSEDRHSLQDSLPASTSQTLVPTTFHDEDSGTENDGTRLTGEHESGPRVKREVRVRGRSKRRQEAPAPYPSPRKPKNSHASDLEQDLEPIRPQRKAKSFRIDETDKVVAFLGSRLKRMQQLADKKIAKAWIKGICPKKQAKFPYQNNKKDPQAGENPEVPGWWPEPNGVCRFVEPDHIRRDERMKLCLHLLRLRPSPEQLKAWNKDMTEPHPIHRNVGWTAFLQELAGPEIFDDLPKEDKKRKQQRQELLHQMYQVAQMEEDFQIGGIDGSEVYSWEEDEEDRKLLPTKRTHQSCTTSTRTSMSRSSSASGSCNRAKRVKGGSLSNESPIMPTQPVEGAMEDIHYDPDQVSNQEPARDHFNFPPDPGSGRPEAFSQSFAAEPQLRQSNPFMGHFETVPMKRESSYPGHTQAQNLPWQPSGMWVAEPVTYCSSQYQNAAQPVQRSKVDTVPEPQFHPMPTVPMFLPMDMTQMPLGNCEIPSESTYPNGMPPAQYFMPANSDHHEFQRPASVPQHGFQQLAERHMTPVQYNGMAFTQPAWHDRQYASQNPT
ncbi:Hypothetical predicted protein [Lecanosticta acicola]|uniref:Subtelomeric hrmA-associated cluster protein AFUB-079030/YDR124W-like helical bundle domain-containing protein n=1 Tax=Lecanosticta acicola TaxID=111012 RepID=A0AAI8YT13_9PEZI|nr:Hypothetical predicted protein [Lecanosticta acicola]